MWSAIVVWLHSIIILSLNFYKWAQFEGRVSTGIKEFFTFRYQRKRATSGPGCHIAGSAVSSHLVGTNRNSLQIPDEIRRCLHLQVFSFPIELYIFKYYLIFNCIFPFNYITKQMTFIFNHFLTKPNEKPHGTGSTKRICSQGLSCLHSSVGGADSVSASLVDQGKSGS